MARLLKTSGTTSGNLTNETFPEGHVTNVFSFSKADVTSEYSEYVHWETAEKVSQKAVGFSAINGRKYHIMSTMSIWPYISSGTSSNVYGYSKLYWGLTERAQGLTQTGDNLLTSVRAGRNVETAASGLHGFHTPTIQGSFTAASTATHYVYQTGQSINSNCAYRAIAVTNAGIVYAWKVTIFEVMP